MRFPILSILTGLLFSAVASASTVTKSRSVPEGYVTTTDGHFSLDGKPFYFIGTNAFVRSL
jgi:mannan endo-1,4-beta-mannosidase